MIKSETQEGIVYVLTNPVMPGIVKIGRTNQNDVKIRMAQLYSTGVPLPFECAYAARVSNPVEVERALHNAFKPSRVNNSREFFNIEEYQAIGILRLLQLENATPDVDNEQEVLPKEELEASENFKKRRPNFNFTEMGIEIGSTLISLDNGEEAIVSTARSVLFRGEEMSLSAATVQILGNVSKVHPMQHWECNGKFLGDYYIETYGERGA